MVEPTTPSQFSVVASSATPSAEAATSIVSPSARRFIFGILALLIILGPGIGLLYFAIAPDNPEQRNEFTRTVAQIVGGFAILAGAYATWRTLLVNERRLAQEREQFERRLAQEREQAERKARQDEFTDILNRFASKDSLALRVNATLRLAALAFRPPLVPVEPPPRTRAHYPLFIEATTQLAAALSTEEDDAVRLAALAALDRLAEFAADATGQPLLDRLIEEMVRTNRDARDACAVALADYEAHLPAPGRRDTARARAEIARLARFGARGDLGRTALVALTNLSAFEIRLMVKHEQQRHEPVGGTTDRMTTFALRAAQLRACRDALAAALRRRAAPDRPLDLTGTFLAGADLQEAFLCGAHLSEALLHETNLERANLVGARLWQTHIDDRTSVTGASWPEANFCNPADEANQDTALREHLRYLASDQGDPRFAAPLPPLTPPPSTPVPTLASPTDPLTSPGSEDDRETDAHPDERHAPGE